MMKCTKQFERALHLKPGLHNVDLLEIGAKFDESGKYRYSLWRTWSLYQPHIVYVLLNPSTADEHRNDPTIRRCIEFAPLFGRDRQVLSMLSAMKVVYCLGITRDGHPRHPWYVKCDTTLVPYIAQI